MKNQPNIPANEHLAVYFQPHSPVPKVFKFIYGDTPEELAIHLQHAKEKAMNDSNSTADIWLKLHGEDWKQTWKECFGVSFDEQVDLKQDMQLMTREEFRTAERQALIDNQPLKVISVQEYYDALEEDLLSMGSDSKCSWFLMSEFYTCNYTSMYLKAKIGGEVVAGTRLVDVNDPTTWITVQELETKVQKNKMKTSFEFEYQGRKRSTK